MEKHCLVCGKEFKHKNYWQKYCSNVCKQAMWAIKKFDINIIKKVIERGTFNG